MKCTLWKTLKKHLDGDSGVILDQVYIYFLTKINIVSKS